jgi:pimeloyl-ACP methyl ester carboxylesterase
MTTTQVSVKTKDHTGAEVSVSVSVSSYGAGRPVLLLHGGAGPQSMTGFAEQLAAAHHVNALVPTHPGFGGTDRPAALTSIRPLADLYDDLIDELGLGEVTIIGNSIGGWLTAELALLKSPRIRDIVLIDAVGIEVPGHPVADFFNLTMDEVFSRSFHNPEPFRVDPASMPPQAQAVAAGNRAALSAYAGESMSDPTLAARLSSLTTPTLVLWGASDQIVDADYGRAYAQAIPTAHFELLTETGHSPQMETPAQVLKALHDTIFHRPDTAD